MSLIVQNLSVAFRNKQGDLVRSVNLEVGNGEVLGLLGRNGAGKSIIARSICGLLPDELFIKNGSIELNGYSLPDVELFREGRLAYISQNFFQYFNPLVKMKSQIEEIAGEGNAFCILEKCNLDTNIAEKFPDQVSGGTILQILFYASLAKNPLICISDESTSMLDFKNRCRLLSHLKELCEKRDIPLILISHDLDVISQHSSKISVMQNGSILESDFFPKLSHSTQHEETKLLIQGWEIPSTSVLNESYNPTLKVKNVAKKYDGKTLLDDINLQMERNSITGITGARGSGKTIFCKILCNLIEKDGGEVTFSEGKAPSYHMIYQNVKDSFNPTMKVAEILNEACENRAKQMKLMSNLKMNLKILDRYVKNLSGGELQKVAIVRALLLNSQILICDEITSNLDVVGQREVLEMLSQVHKEKPIIIVIVSHDSRIMKNFCHDKYRLEKGKLVSI